MTVHPDDDDEKEMQPDTHITIAMDGTDQLPQFRIEQPSDVCVPQSPTVPQNRIELFIADVPWAILPSAFPSASVDEIPALVSDDGEIPELVEDCT